MGNLFIVSTPIGNLQDITLRALQVLRSAHCIFAEDTRRARILLTHHEITARVRSLYSQNEQKRVDEVCASLREGRIVALLSDAGTPLLSDPGNFLVAQVLEQGFQVVPIPGPSAILSALVISGIPVMPFAFLGFLPRRAGGRTALLKTYQGRPETLVIFESPQRLAATLRDLAKTLGPRRACVARELTKLHEETRRGMLEALAEHFEKGVRGEVTIIVEGVRDLARKTLEDESSEELEALDQEIRALFDQGYSCKEITAQLAPELGVAKREIYARALALKEAT